MIVTDARIAFIVAAFFATIVGSGVYGFGHDYYAAYFNPNLQWGGLSDQLGYALATLTVYDLHVGVYLTSFLLAFSAGLLIYKLAEMYKIHRGFCLFASYIVLIHTWPIIMSTSNAMRQGIMMSFIFFSLYFYLLRSWKLFILLAASAFLSHKSAALYVGLLLIIYAIDVIAEKKVINIHGRFMLTMIAGFAIIGSVLMLPYLLGEIEESRIIRGDFRPFLFLINLSYLVFFYLLRRNHIDAITRYLFLFSAVAPVFLFSGLNWQYERINMVLLIPYMVIFSRLFAPKFRASYLLVVSSTLLALTFYTGMYASFS